MQQVVDLKIAMLYGLKDKLSKIPDVVVGFFAWQDKWVLYAPEKVLTELGDISEWEMAAYHCVENEKGIFMMDDGILTVADLGWIDWLHGAFHDRFLNYSRGDTETISEKEFNRLRMVFGNASS